MKKTKLFLSMLAVLAMVGCSSGIRVNSDNNYDSDVTSDITDSGDPNSYDSELFSGDSIETPESYDTFSGGKITANGDYYLQGEYSKIEISKNLNVNLFFDGASISSSESEGLVSGKGCVVNIILLNETSNYVVNDFADANALHIKGDAHILGSGSLTINSAQKNGLKVSQDLYLSGDVTLNVTGANHAISARSIRAKDVAINATAKAKDGMQLEVDSNVTAFTKEQGFAELVNVKYSANVKGDGIQADSFVYISGGTYDITSETENVSDAFVQYSSSILSDENYDLVADDFKYVYQNGAYKRVAKDEIHSLSSKYYALVQSMKGIKAGAIKYTNESSEEVEVTTGDYAIYVAHTANITIDSYDDCIHTNYGDTTVDSSNLTLDTFDDGVHADYNLNVNNASIQINSSYEGLEGANITIDGEQTNIIANSDDDGINAANDSVNFCNIYIKNGYIRVYASGDGIDANAYLYLQGGKVIVEGPGNGNGSLDASRINFNGGIVFACSTNGMTETMSATQYTFIWQGSTISAGSLITIQDSSGNQLFQYTLKQSCNQIIFSHPDMVSGGTYKIINGSSQVASITMTSTLTKSGSSQGGGPGGGGGHGGGGGPGGWGN